MPLVSIGEVTWYRTRIDELTSMALAQGTQRGLWWTAQVTRVVRAERVDYYASAQVQPAPWSAEWTPPPLRMAERHDSMSEAKRWVHAVVSDAL